MEQAHIDPRNLTVLVVDDEPRLVDVVRLNLEMEGYRVITAANGYEPACYDDQSGTHWAASGYQLQQCILWAAPSVYQH